MLDGDPKGAIPRETMVLRCSPWLSPTQELLNTPKRQKKTISKDYGVNRPGLGAEARRVKD